MPVRSAFPQIKIPLRFNPFHHCREKPGGLPTLNMPLPFGGLFATSKLNRLDTTFAAIHKKDNRIDFLLKTPTRADGSADLGSLVPTPCCQTTVLRRTASALVGALGRSAATLASRRFCRRQLVDIGNVELRKKKARLARGRPVAHGF